MTRSHARIVNVTQNSDIRQKDSKHKLSAAARKHQNSSVINNASVMTRFAFKVKRKGPEYKVEDWLCSKYIKETRRSHVKGIESREMEGGDHFKFTPAAFLNMGAI
jgi:hypothetical protein